MKDIIVVVVVVVVVERDSSKDIGWIVLKFSTHIICDRG